MTSSASPSTDNQLSPDQSIIKGLSSTEHRKVARALSDVLLQEIEKDPHLGGAVVADSLSWLRDIVWAPVDQKNPVPLDTDEMEKSFQQILHRVPENAKSNLVEAYVRMGHLYEIAGLHARQNYFDECRRKNKPIPGGAKEMMNVFKRENKQTQEIVKALNRPVFEMISTMHPTNVNSLESMKLQRAIGIEAARIASGKQTDLSALRTQVQTFALKPLNHMKAGADAHLTVHDETEIMLYHLGNIYEDMPLSYRGFDDVLSKHGDGRYDPLSLKLDFRPGSWGSSGDKDGNDNVTAETTLEAIAMHKAAIMERYAHEFEALGVADNLALKQWAADIQQWNELLKPLLHIAAELREEQFSLVKEDAREAHDKKFDDLSHKLAQIRPDAKAFEEALTQAYNTEEDPGKKAGLLNFIRRVRTFGFTFGKIEYRETADRYKEVVDTLMTPEVLGRTSYGDQGQYLMLDEVKQRAVLSDLFKHKNPEEGTSPRGVDTILTADKKLEIIHNGAGQSYEPDNALPITYHTLKRMELARDHPDMIQDNVLAECTSATRIMEAKFLQSVIPANDQGKKALLGIIPLFEEKESITVINDIMKAAFDNSVYKQHLQELAQARHGGKKTQQVQIAHSDNARRAGFAAARGFIHQAHHDFRALCEQQGIQPQFFEGGSLSDAYRNGVRAISGAVNAFGLHDFAKFTFQGGDMLNYFNQPSSAERVLTRSFVHQALKCAGLSENSEKTQTLRGASCNSCNPIIDQVVRKALARAFEEYKEDDFLEDKIGMMMAHLHYNEETEAQNRGSRAAKREAKKGPKFAKVENTQLGAVHPVPIQSIRTIAFSESMAQNAIIPSWVGAGRLEDYISQVLVEKVISLNIKESLTDDERQFVDQFKDFKDEKAPPLGKYLNVIRAASPTFRNVTDGMAFGIALTDMTHPGGDKKALESLPYFQRLKNDYLSAGRTTLRALSPDYTPEPDEAQPAAVQPTPEQARALAGMKNMVQSQLPQLQQTICDKEGYRRFLIFAKQNMPLYGGEKSADDHTKHLRIVAHSGLDTVTHGRYLGADDPAYGRAVYAPSQGASVA